MGRRRAARLEGPLRTAGLLLVALHLLDLALAGSRTTIPGVLALVLVAGTLVLGLPRAGRATRAAVALALGALAAGFGTAAHVLDVVLADGPRWPDVTGIGFALGGVLLLAAGGCALAAPASASAPPRSGRARALRAMLWVVGALLVGQFLVLPFAGTLLVTHAARTGVDPHALRVRHADVSIPSPAGELAGWWVPSRNGAALLVVHGSGGSRAGTARHAALLARLGYGVLAIDLPGHGESGGHANLLGSGAQPALAAALGWLARRPGVDPHRLGGLGLSLGAEVLLEAATRDRRLRAVVADGAERAADDRELGLVGGVAGVVDAVGRGMTRVVSGEPEAPPLLDRLGRIAPRRVLLIAAGGRPHEAEVDRRYAQAIGPSARLWVIGQAGHTKGLAARPREYAARVRRFLAAALGPR
jgi:hypothetical protein